MENLNKKELGLASTTVRQIQLRINAFIHDKDFTHPVTRDEEEHKVFTEQKKCLPHFSVLERRVPKWEAPLNGFHKVHWDASINRLNKKIDI